MSISSFKLLIATILLSSLVVPLFAQQFTQTTEVRAEITSLSSPVQVRRGSIIRVTVSIKNTGTEARTFYVGASIIGEGETTWKDLPGWGTTTSISPGSTGSFTFGDYTIPADAYIGYHGIYVKLWTDSTKSTVVTDRWFEKVVQVVSVGAEIVDLTITVVQY